MNDFALKVTQVATEPSTRAELRGQRTSSEQIEHERLAPEPKPQPTKVQVEAVVEQIESFLKSSRRELQFQVDEESGRVVVRVRDGATGELIRQIPGEDVLKMARALHDKTQVFLDLTV